MPTEQGIAWVHIGAASNVCWQPPGCDHPVRFFTIDNPGKYAQDAATRREIAIWNTVCNQVAGSLSAGDDPNAHFTPEQKSVLAKWLPEQCAKYGCTPGAAAGGPSGMVPAGSGQIVASDGSGIGTGIGGALGILDRQVIGPIKIWHVIAILGIALIARKQRGA